MIQRWWWCYYVYRHRLCRCTSFILYVFIIVMWLWWRWWLIVCICNITTLYCSFYGHPRHLNWRAIQSMMNSGFWHSLKTMHFLHLWYCFWGLLDSSGMHRSHQCSPLLLCVADNMIEREELPICLLIRNSCFDFFWDEKRVCHSSSLAGVNFQAFPSAIFVKLEYTYPAVTYTHHIL